METKWQEKWNYYGWKEYLDITPERDTMQKDWNSTFVTKINFLAKQIKGLDENAEIGISVHPNLYETLIKKIPFNKVDGDVIYVSLRYLVNLDSTLPEDKVYIYQKGVDENIGEILIDFVTETRD
jgi:hypothetical protein